MEFSHLLFDLSSLLYLCAFPVVTCQNVFCEQGLIVLRPFLRDFIHTIQDFKSSKINTRPTAFTTITTIAATNAILTVPDVNYV